MNRAIFHGILAVWLALGLAGCDEKGEGIKSEVISQKQERESPYFTLVFHDGGSLRLERHEKGIYFEGKEGKAVLLSFFATWCPSCKAQVPHLVNLQKSYEGRLEVLGVAMQNSLSSEEAQRFAMTFEVNYPLAISEENQRLAKALGGINSIPFMILYDPQGRYVTHYIGAVPEEMIEFDIKRALERS